MKGSLARPKKWPIVLSFCWTGIILSLGAWWLYLLVKLGQILQDSPLAIKDGIPKDFVKLAKYEGLTFFVLLVSFLFYIFYLYFRDVKRVNSLSTFYASLTHELKTPLASIKMQNEMITLFSKENKKVETYLRRLNQDTIKLESELDKILYLARIESGADLFIQKLNLSEVLDDLKNKVESKIEFELPPNEVWVHGDRVAVSIILKNLVNNTFKHVGAEASVFIKVICDKGSVSLIYKDSGTETSINKNELGKAILSTQGDSRSGIGLYLCGQLMLRMRGRIAFQVNQGLEVTLVFKEALR